MNGIQDRIRRVAGHRAFTWLRGGASLFLPLLAVAALGLAPCPAWSKCKLETFEIPVRTVHSRPIAMVGLNGTEVPMLIDSGAFFSMLTESTASQLNLRLQRLPDGLRIEGHTGSLDAKLTRVSKVQLKGAELSNVEFIVGVNELGAGIMGVLGRNFLSVADTEYDLAHGIVRLVFPKGDCEDVNLAYWAGNDAPVNAVPLSGTSRTGTAIRVIARINGVKVTALMDTGAGTTVNLRVARRAGVKDADMVPLGRTGGGGAGHAQLWLAPFASFELGGEKISNNRLEIDDAGGSDYDMLLGIDYFLSHRIYVSRLQNKLYATWNGGAVFAHDKIGETDDTARYAAAPQPVAPDDADALARRAEASAARGDTTHALEDLDRACVLAPRVARYFLARARVRAAIKQPAQALDDLDAALRLDPSLHDARVWRASWRASVGDREGALADLQSLDTALPPSSHWRDGVAHVYAGLGLAPEALRQWDLWVSSHRNDAGLGSVLNDRCWLQTRLKLDLKRALDDCKQALKEDDENASFHDSLGWTYLRLDDPARAIKAFDQAIKLRELSPLSYYGRAQANRRLGNTEAAKRDLVSARKLNPEIDDEVGTAGFDIEARPIVAPGGLAAEGSSEI